MPGHDLQQYRIEEAIAARTQRYVEGVTRLEQRTDDCRGIMLHAQEGIPGGGLDPATLGADCHDALSPLAGEGPVGQRRDALLFASGGAGGDLQGMCEMEAQGLLAGVPTD